MMSSSIRLLLTGLQVDCTTKTSQPRTVSLIETEISPSANAVTVLSPRSSPSSEQIPRAKGMLELALNTLIWLPCAIIRSTSVFPSQTLFIMRRRVGGRSKRSARHRCRIDPGSHASRLHPNGAQAQKNRAFRCGHAAQHSPFHCPHAPFGYCKFIITDIFCLSTAFAEEFRQIPAKFSPVFRQKAANGAKPAKNQPFRAV